MKRVGVAALAALLTLFPISAYAAPQSEAAGQDVAQQTTALAELKKKLAEKKSSTEIVDVIIMLKNQPHGATSAQERANVAAQSDVVADFAKEYQLAVDRQFGYLVNGFSGKVSADKIAKIALDPRVESVKRERMYYPTEASARGLEGVAQAFEDYGVDGTGMVISIVDTGIDATHQDMRLDAGVFENAKIKNFDATKGFTEKVPAGYNYADENWTVKDTTTSMHGMHVAGIAAANGSEGDVPPDPTVEGRIDGVAPNAQLLAMKVFSNDGSGGASDSDIIAAIEDSVKLGADVINISLGSPNGTENASDGSYRAIAAAREAGVLTLVAAGNDGLQFSDTGATTDLQGYHDDATIGTPSLQGAAFSVASVDNSIVTNPKAIWQGSDATDHAVAYLLASSKADGQAHEIVDIGLADTPDQIPDLTGKYALVERGGNTFTEKFQNAIDKGATGVVVFNSAEGGDEFVGMAGLEAFTTTFGASITRTDGLAIKEALKSGAVNISFTEEVMAVANPTDSTPSSFTSWGPTPNLDFAPEIAGIGGSVYSTFNDNTYGTNSGTSMATPNLAGLSALLMQQYKKDYPELSGPALLDQVQTSLMNTALAPKTTEGTPAAPRQVGAGLAQIDKALANMVFATVDGTAAASLKEVAGSKSFTITLENKGDAQVTYSLPKQEVINETNNADGSPVTTSVSSESLTTDVDTVTVPAHGTATVTATLNASSGDHFVEGWVKFESQTDGAPNISVPYLGFAGDWNAERILDADKEGGNFEYFAPPMQSEDLFTTQLIFELEGSVLPIDLADYGLFKTWLSPNGDQSADAFNANLALLRNAGEVQYEVLDPNGKLIKILGQEQDISRNLLGDHITSATNTGALISYTGSGAFDGLVWNQQAGKFEPVPDGDGYTYRIKTRLGPDFDWQVDDFSFGVDNTAPVVELGEIEDGILHFTASDALSGLAETPTAIDASFNQLDVTEVSPGVFEATLDDENTDFVAILAQDQGFSMTMATKVVQQSTLLVPDAEIFDGEDVVLSPSSQLVDTSTDPATLHVEGFASSDIAKVTINDEEVEIVNGDFIKEVPLAQGENVFTVIGYGTDGEEITRVQLTPVYDSVPPVVTLDNSVLDDAGNLKVNSDGTVTIKGKIADERADAKLTVQVENPVPPTEYELNHFTYDEFIDTPVAEDGSFSHTFTPKAEQVSYVVIGSDGANRTELATPIAGAIAPAEDTGYVLPTITNTECTGLSSCFVDPASDDVSDDSVTLRGELPSGTKSITFTPTERAQEDGTFIGGEPIAAQIGDGSFSVTLPNLVTGINDFRLEIVDANGDTVVDQSFHVYFDLVPPQIDFTSPTGLLNGGALSTPTIITNQDEVNVAGHVFDDGWGYKFKVNDSVIREFFNMTGFGDTSNGYDFGQVLPVSDGDQLAFEVQDSMANYLAAVVPVIVDKEKPTITAEGLKGGEVISKIDKDRIVKLTLTDSYADKLDVKLLGPSGEEVSVQANKAVTRNATINDAFVNPADNSTEDRAGEGFEQSVSHTIDTSALHAGQYTLVATGSDLAGNVATQTLSFVVDRAGEITGEDEVTVNVDREALSDQVKLQADVLKNWVAQDDGSVAANGTDFLADAVPTLSFAKDTVLLEGTNEVTVVATDASGFTVERTVKVNLVLNEHTLTDSVSGVSVTGTLRGDDVLTVKTSGENPKQYTISNNPDFATLPVLITLPGSKDATIYRVLADGARAQVQDAVFADGKWSFYDDSKGVYEVNEPQSKSDPGHGKLQHSTKGDPNLTKSEPTPVSGILTNTGTNGVPELLTAALVLVAVGAIITRRKWTLQRA